MEEVLLLNAILVSSVGVCVEGTDRADCGEVLEDLFFQVLVSALDIFFVTLATDVINLVISAPVCFSLYLHIS